MSRLQLQTLDETTSFMSLDSSSPWLTAIRSETVHTRVRLICAPYAGGSSTNFRSWLKRLPADVALYSIELPGRCNRFQESFVVSMETLLQHLVTSVGPHLDRPFVLFGHSLGAAVIFEFARWLQQRDVPQPIRLILSGQRAFHRPAPRSPIHDFPDDQFLSEIQRYGGTPHGLFEDKELRSVFLPLLRADFTLGETYEYQDGPPLKTSLSVYGGLEDEEVSIADVKAWERYTDGEFNWRMFPGNHFFLHQHEALFIQSLLADMGV
jgi:surfactin synthase thioesterase subunit